MNFHKPLSYKLFYESALNVEMKKTSNRSKIKLSVKVKNLTSKKLIILIF